MYNKALAVLQEAELESKMAWDKVKFHLKLRQPMDAMKTLMSLVTKDPANLRARAYTGSGYFFINCIKKYNWVILIKPQFFLKSATPKTRSTHQSSI